MTKQELIEILKDSLCVTIDAAESTEVGMVAIRVTLNLKESKDQDEDDWIEISSDTITIRPQLTIF